MALRFAHLPRNSCVLRKLACASTADNEGLPQRHCASGSCTLGQSNDTPWETSSCNTTLEFKQHGDRPWPSPSIVLLGAITLIIAQVVPGCPNIDVTDSEIDAPITQGEKGDKGDPPEHEWDGTSLRFENSDGTWGTLVDLQGPTGDTGEKGRAW